MGRLKIWLSIGAVVSGCLLSILAWGSNTLALLCAIALIAAIVLTYAAVRRSRAHSELAQERDLLRILLDNIPDYIYFKDADSKFIRINKALATRFGLPDPEAARGRSTADFFDPETVTRLHADDQRILASWQPITAELEHVSRAGVTRWFSTTKVPVKDGSAAGPVIVGISRDVTEWKRTLEQLQSSEASFRRLFSVIPYAACVCDRETLEILEVNTAASTIYGYSPEEFRTMRLTDFFPPGEREELHQTLDTFGPANQPGRSSKHLTKDGRLLDVEVAVHVFEFHGRSTILCIAQDVSARKRMEVDLLHSQKLEAVGELAAGIAHEINTPVQYVGDNLRFLRDAFQDRQSVFLLYEQLLDAALTGQIPRDLLAKLKAARADADLNYLAAEIPKAMEQSLDGVELVATIVRATKAFAHPGSTEKMPADLNKALANALIVARNELKYTADVVTDFGDLPLVWCSLGDLNQVFLNLLVNAAHAIAPAVKNGGPRGEIRLSTRCENHEAVISISDTGCGIPEAIRSRVFDPFFTTKEVGKGTGQGLAIARNIVVERHGGRISFAPNTPRGTTFSVFLPVGVTPGTAEKAPAELASQ